MNRVYRLVFDVFFVFPPSIPTAHCLSREHYRTQQGVSLKKNPPRMKIYSNEKVFRGQRRPHTIKFSWQKRIQATRKLIEDVTSDVWYGIHEYYVLPGHHFFVQRELVIKSPGKLLLRHVYKDASLLSHLIIFCDGMYRRLSEESYLAILQDVQEHGFDHRHTSEDNNPLLLCISLLVSCPEHQDPLKYECMLLLAKLLLQQPSAAPFLAQVQQKNELAVVGLFRVGFYHYVNTSSPDINLVSLLYRSGVFSSFVLGRFFRIYTRFADPMPMLQFLMMLSHHDLLHLTTIDPSLLVRPRSISERYVTELTLCFTGRVATRVSCRAPAVVAPNDSVVGSRL